MNYMPTDHSQSPALTPIICREVGPVLRHSVLLSLKISPPSFPSVVQREVDCMHPLILRGERASFVREAESDSATRQEICGKYSDFPMDSTCSSTLCAKSDLIDLGSRCIQNASAHFDQIVKEVK